MRPTFSLAVVTSADGFIARAPDDAPQNWASPEEQELFFGHVEAADWAIMGRHTHLAADKPYRRRIVFSTTVAGWQRPTQFWTDPRAHMPTDLARLVRPVHPLRNGLILGGTNVHDWFLAHRAIDALYLTIEPVRFGAGLSIFSTQSMRDPQAALQAAGFERHSDEVLNGPGTRYQLWRPGRAPA